jgi:hypothetical protein
LSERGRQRLSLKQIGLWGTCVYLIALVGGVFIAAKHGWITPTPLSLNELGDLLAGAFGPLAIGWVVLGFLQQGEELKESRKALEMQAQELRNAVAQHEAMVKVATDTLEHERDTRTQEEARKLEEIKPRLSFRFEDRKPPHQITFGQFDSEERDLVVTNAGGHCFHLNIAIQYIGVVKHDDVQSSHFSVASIPRAGSMRLEVTVPRYKQREIRVSYTDAHDNPYSHSL